MAGDEICANARTGQICDGDTTDDGPIALIPRKVATMIAAARPRTTGECEGSMAVLLELCGSHRTTRSGRSGE